MQTVRILLCFFPSLSLSAWRNIARHALMPALAAATLVACSKPEPPVAGIRPALAYKIISGAATETEIYAGDIHARIETDHAFRIGGKITKRLVDAGATVKKGQVLARLDPQDATLAADAARAQVAAQRTEAEFADAELKRFRELFAKGFVSQSALDQKINVANAAKARLDAQRAAASVSINQAGYAALVAETDGVVTQIASEAGQVVAAGQTVMKIANPKDKEVAITVPEAKLAEFRAEAKNTSTTLSVGLWSQPVKRYAAKVREIGGVADAITRTYLVRLSVQDPDDAVQLGMTAYAVFGNAVLDDTLSVPLSALYATGKTVGVWHIGADGKVALRPVTVLQYRENSAFIKPIAGNVKVGDLIVAAGVHKLRDGEIIKPVIDPSITGDGKVAGLPNRAPELAAIVTAKP